MQFSYFFVPLRPNSEDHILMRLFVSFVFSLFMALTMAAQEPLHVVILGDSNTWIGGDDCDKPQGWNKWFKDLLKPTTCKSYARSGATWTNTPQTRRNTQENIGVLGDNNVIYNQICRLQEAVERGAQVKPQLILIMAGTNDAWFLKQRPKAFSMCGCDAFSTDNMTDRPINEILTLAESVRYGCELLKAAYPEARIVLLTPLQSVAAGIDNITKAGDIIECSAKHLGLNVIRMDKEGGIDAKKEKVKHQLTTDGTHTSEKGAQLVGTFVAKQIAALLQPSIQ